MTATLPFDQAVETLEITDLKTLTQEMLQDQVRRMKKRWHPDRIAALKDPDLLAKFTENFQRIDPAAELLTAYLNGTYHVGDRFAPGSDRTRRANHEIIRDNAAELQGKLRDVWPTVRAQGYKHSTRTVELSDGFVLRDLLTEDFRDDVASVSIISFLTFSNVVVLALLLSLIFGPSPINTLLLWSWLLVAVSTFLTFLPLSRFWLPDLVQQIVFPVTRFGLGLFNTLADLFQFSWIVTLSLMWIKLVAKAIKYLVLGPLYLIAKLLVKDRRVGVVTEQVDYYAGTADWYVDELLTKAPAALAEEELYNLSHLYTELTDVRPVPVPVAA